MFQLQPLSQMDPRWKDHLLGLDQSSTIGKYGCLLTSMTMVANGLGASETPASLNDKMKAAGGFIDDLIIPGAMPGVVPKVRYSRRIQCNNPPAPLGEIDSALLAGLPVIIKVDYSPVTGIQDHWIVLVDKQGSDYVIQDPWPYPAETKQVLLTTRYGFAGAPDRIILDTLFYTGAAAPKPKPPANLLPVPANPLVVYAAAEDLALRAQPIVTEETLIERIALGARLLALEDSSGARAKVGQMNNWIQVQVDADGQQGYVAAWFVTLSQQEVPEVNMLQAQPTGQPDPQTTALVVYSTGDGLALRSQPVISDTTLVKRVSQNTQFSVLDPSDMAKARIGVQGQWLNVQDVQGAKGYVAAWYVSLTPADALLGVDPVSQPMVTTSTPAPGEPLSVRTTDEGVALRSQPVIAAATLIKRLPIGSDLAVIEPAAGAQAKIGAAGQWLKVRDITGNEGYIAAWYVVKSPLPTSTPAGNP
jgi:hypothetical protein